MNIGKNSTHMAESKTFLCENANRFRKARMNGAKTAGMTTKDVYFVNMVIQRTTLNAPRLHGERPLSHAMMARYIEAATNRYDMVSFEFMADI